MGEERIAQRLPSAPATPTKIEIRRKPLPKTPPANAGNVPQGWPSEPSFTKPTVFSIESDLLVDIILLTLSTLFLAFALIVNQYDGSSTAHHPQATSRLMSATKFGPSVFPILFAAVVGRATHSVLLWRLEKGDRIGILDLLASSTSLTSTFVSQLKLRILSLFGFALLLLWAWSPVGGQASFRQLTIGNRTASQPASFTYMTHGGNMNNFDFSDRATNWAIVNTLYVASIIAPAVTKLSPRDTWSNVKVPLIEKYEKNSSADGEGWYKYKAVNADDSTYASLVRIPITGTNSSDFINYNLTIESEYLLLDCPVVNATPPTGGFSARFNASGYGSILLWDEDFRQRNKTDVLSTERTPFNFTYVDYLSHGMSQCIITTTYIELEVACPTALTCGASRFRRSRAQNPPAAFTKLDLYTGYQTSSNWQLFAGALVTAVQGHPETPTVAKIYLAETLNPIEVLPHVYVLGTTSKPTVSSESYVSHLNQLINTYWASINGMYALSGGISVDTAYIDNSTSDRVLTNVSTTGGTRSTRTTVLEAHIGWVVTLAMASAIMIIASLIPPIIRSFLTRAPDIAINVSSLATRNNPYVVVPANGTFLDASDRARLLKDLQLRFGDVNGDAENGRLAVASWNASKAPKVSAVVKGRLYE